MTVTDHPLDGYEQWLREKNRYTGPTINQYLSGARSLCRCADGPPETLDGYMHWIEHMKSQGKEPSTINTYHTFAIKYLEYTGVEYDPADARSVIPEHDPNSLPEPLTQTQIKSLRNATQGAEEEAVVVVLYHTGLRNSEARDLTWDDIAWDRGDLSVRRRKKKSWARDTLPLYDDQLAVLTALRDLRADDNPHVFPAYNSPQGIGATVTEPKPEGCMCGDTLRNRVGAVATRSSVGCHVWPHLFRHSRATHMLEEGANLTYVNQFFDHESMEMTRRYARLTGSTLRQEDAADSAGVIGED